MSAVEEFAALMALVVRVKMVSDLEEESIWLPKQELLFVDDAMSMESEVVHLHHVRGYAFPSIPVTAVGVSSEVWPEPEGAT